MPAAAAPARVGLLHSLRFAISTANMIDVPLRHCERRESAAADCVVAALNALTGEGDA